MIKCLDIEKESYNKNDLELMKIIVTKLIEYCEMCKLNIYKLTKEENQIINQFIRKVEVLESLFK